jgi:hypothetical protein
MKRPGRKLATLGKRLIRSCLGKLNKTKAISTNQDRQKPYYVIIPDALTIARGSAVSTFTPSDIYLICDELGSSLLIMSLLLSIGARGGDLTWSFEG